MSTMVQYFCNSILRTRYHVSLQGRAKFAAWTKCKRPGDTWPVSKLLIRPPSLSHSHYSLDMQILSTKFGPLSSGDFDGPAWPIKVGCSVPPGGSLQVWLTCLSSLVLTNSYQHARVPGGQLGLCHHTSPWGRTPRPVPSPSPSSSTRWSLGQADRISRSSAQWTSHDLPSVTECSGVSGPDQNVHLTSILQPHAVCSEGEEIRKGE